MTRQKGMGLCALAIVAIHLVLRVFGGATHASILTGMPQSEGSFVLGPLHVLFTFGAVLVSPVLAIAAALEAWYARSHDENALPNAVRRRASVSGRL